MFMIGKNKFHTNAEQIEMVELLSKKTHSLLRHCHFLSFLSCAHNFIIINIHLNIITAGYVEIYAKLAND